MARQIIRLTESDLHKIIKESVKKVIREGWHDELTSLYDDGKKDGSTGVDIDKVSSILKKLKKEYGKDTEGYKNAVNKFYSDREKVDDAEKARRDPAFELWKDELETKFNDEGYPMAKDFKPMPYDKKKYGMRVKNGELPRAARRISSKDDFIDDEEPVDNPYKGKSADELERMMRDSGYIK